MRKLIVMLFALVSVRAFADVTDTIPTDQWLGELFGVLGGLKGASALAIAAVATQVVMKLAQTPLAAVAGKWRLTAVCVLSLAAAVLTQMAAGSSFVAALVNGSTLAAVQVLAHQVWTQFNKTT